MPLETVQRIEPARIEDVPCEIADLIAELAAKTAVLGRALHPRTASELARLVRVMNTYYTNLIEGHNTRPKDIERAMAGEFDTDQRRRDLQSEAAAHMRVQAQLDQMAFEGKLPEPASTDFILWLHREFYREAPASMLNIRTNDIEVTMQPGAWRSRPGEEVMVGRHQPPSSVRVPDFMAYFAERYQFKSMGKAARILAIPAAHHRMNYIHPFPDGNGRVSRLMSHAMAQVAGIGAHGLWSISRGLARGIESRSDYRRMMDHADAPRQGNMDGRGNLSRKALADFVTWYLRVCVDQVQFMSDLFELDQLMRRLRVYVEKSESLKPQAAALLEEALIRGEFERGEAARITGLPERSARRVINDAIGAGLLASATPKGPVSLRFPAHTLESLFPRLYPEV